MLRRIQDIKAIGSFLDDHPASVQFEPLTFIYGENCYGKTTLCDIFRSLNENTPEYLTSRKSVPNPHNHRQHVRLGFLTADSGPETPFTFDGTQWNPLLPASTRLLVFDNNFIHRNVFTGQVIDRRNQENLTDWILGDEGTVKAENIRQLNSHLRAVKKEIQQLLDVNFRGLRNVDSFVAMDAHEDPQEIQVQIDNLGIQIVDKRALLDNLSKAAGRTEPRELVVPDRFQTFFQDVNNLLLRTYARVHADAAETVAVHIQQKTRALPTTEQWISHGLGHIQNEDCPFCGQNLNDQALALLDAYREHFDTAFNRFVAEITSALQQVPGRFDVFRLVDLPQQIRENEHALAEYPELSKDLSFSQLTPQLVIFTKELIDNWQSWQTHYDNANRLLADRIRAKQMSMHIETDEWDCHDAASAYTKLVQKALAYNQVLSQMIAQIAEFKRGLSADVLRREINLFERQHADFVLKQRRQQSAAACTRYAELLKDSTNTDSRIAILQQELEKEQSQFIENYFDSIDDLFSRLGSSSFSISKVQTRRGNRPVIALTASYSGLPIEPDQLSAFFGESDRRALALSIFWAKANLLSDQEKKSSVLILDDPVTSFDEGRIDRAIRLIDGAREPFGQVIVLSHYPRFLKSFFDRAHLRNGGIQVAQIIKASDSSKLETASILDFTETDHQAKFRHIVNFIERQHREDICLDLRIFLEAEVTSRYWKQIADNNITATGFKDLLDALRGVDVLSQDLRDEIEQFRLSLNPDHHSWTGRSHEDKIALASDVLDFTYSRL